MDFGKNRPYEKNFPAAHDCPKDDQGKEIMRQGYAITQTAEGKSKVVCLIAQNQQTKLPTSTTSTATAARNIASSDAVLAQLNELKADVRTVSNNIGALTVQLNKLATKQNEDISALYAIVQNYTEHNPLSGQFADLISILIQHVPKSALEPKTADELI